MNDCSGCREVEIDSFGNFPDESALEQIAFLGMTSGRDSCGDYVEDKEYRVRCRTCGGAYVLTIHGDYVVLGVTWSGYLSPAK